MRSLKTARRKMLLRTKSDRMSKLCCAPAQDAYSPARRVYGDDVLSFNPWHCIEEHRPLGSIMHVRIKAYEKSSSFRHQMNVQPRVEPKDINELPL
jgi:hypothetical protein